MTTWTSVFQPSEASPALRSCPWSWRSASTRRWCRPASPRISSASSAIARAAPERGRVSTRTRLMSQTCGSSGVSSPVTCRPARRSATAASSAARVKARARSNGFSAVVLVLGRARAADHDLLLLDRDLDGPVAGPVLGVDGVVLHGGIEPQAVALLAVVERRLERGGATLATAAVAATATPAAAGLIVLVGRLLGLLAGLGLRGGFRGGLLGRLRRLLRLGVELGRDLGVVLRAEVDLLVGGAVAAVAVLLGRELVLALEGLDLLDGDFELVGNPRIGAALTDPRADLVELRTQRFPSHVAAQTSERNGRLCCAPTPGRGPRSRGSWTISATRRAAMLVLTRKANQSIMIGDDIEVSILAVMGEKVRIGIQAPRDVPVFRREVYLEIQEESGGEASVRDGGPPAGS